MRKVYKACKIIAAVGTFFEKSGDNYTVEIYVNDELIDTASSDENGTVEFTNTKLPKKYPNKYIYKIVYLGLADGTIFAANNAQSGGKLYLPGISNLYTGNGANLVWHAGNDGSGSGLDADLLVEKINAFLNA